jgi:UDP-N-acetylmuramate--alanine ligase
LVGRSGDLFRGGHHIHLFVGGIYLSIMVKKSVHFIGIGGTGLSAIARVLLESGYIVSGSDRQMSPLALELQTAGVRVVIGHSPENIAGADFVIRSSAIPDNHIEVLAARDAGIPVLKRAEFLPQLLVGKRVIAVAGTHGKTTTTAMVAWMLSTLGVDPSFVVGGVVENLGVNATAGNGPFFVIEADEYDRMFVGIKPEIALVTNVEHDHPDCFPSPENFFQAFVEFAQGINPVGGILIACAENEGSVRLANEISKNHPVIMYGLNAADQSCPVDYLGTNITRSSTGCYSFTMTKNGQRLTDVQLSIPGRHNALNALGAMAVIDTLHLSLEQAVKSLGQFRGAGRRFEVLGEESGVILIDDYAHHPTEIRATLATARERFGDSRIVVVWQPHTYSRILALWDGFTAAFSDADLVVVTDIYAAREQAPQDFSMAEKVDQIKHAHAYYQATLQEASNFLLKELKSGDILLVLSAGDADKISQTVIRGLRIKEKIT